MELISLDVGESVLLGSQRLNLEHTEWHLELHFWRLSWYWSLRRSKKLLTPSPMLSLQQGEDIKVLLIKMNVLPS